MTLVIAHRGASHQAAENTLAAFALAIEQGADMIETDLHLSKDGEIPLVHDAELEGDRVGDLVLGELRERVAGLPTLAEALDELGSRVAFNLELKSHRDHPYPGLAERVLREVKRHGLLAQTLFSCFFDPALASLRELEPAARIGLLISPRSNVATEERASRLGAEAIHPELALVTPELVARAHEKGRTLNVYTVDDPADQRRLVDWGVDGIFTNEPGRLRALLGAAPRIQ